MLSHISSKVENTLDLSLYISPNLLPLQNRTSGASAFQARYLPWLVVIPRPIP